MISTYEIKVFRNVSDNHKFDRELTFWIEKYNQNSNNVFNAKSEAIKKAKSLNYDDDFNYCTYSAELESITEKF